jgi:hypothetical protein
LSNRDGPPGHENARAGDAGAIVKASRRFTSRNSRNNDEKQHLPCADECVYRWPPKPKQAAWLRSLVAQLGGEFHG